MVPLLVTFLATGAVATLIRLTGLDKSMVAGLSRLAPADYRDEIADLARKARWWVAVIVALVVLAPLALLGGWGIWHSLIKKGIEAWASTGLSPTWVAAWPSWLMAILGVGAVLAVMGFGANTQP